MYLPRPGGLSEKDWQAVNSMARRAMEEFKEVNSEGEFVTLVNVKLDLYSGEVLHRVALYSSKNGENRIFILSFILKFKAHLPLGTIMPNYWDRIKSFWSFKSSFYIIW